MPSHDRANEWVGIIHTTAPKFFKGAQKEVMRNRLLLAMLEKRGRIKYNESSTDMTWQIEFSRPPVESYADMGLLSFSRHDAFRQCTIDTRGYVATDAMSKKEKEMNKGTTALINRYSGIMDRLRDAMRDNFCGELFIDGYASGNENRLHGLESFMGDDGATTASDLIANPSDTYAGRSTALGNEGGTWSSDGTSPNATIGNDWPNGQGGYEYDFFSPKLLNWSSNRWGTGSTSWEDNCERVIRRAKIWCTHTSGKKSLPDLCLLNQDMFFSYANKQSSKQRLIIPHKEASDLGFSDTFNQEGIAIHHDYDVPVNTGYVMNLDMMDLGSLTSDLFWPEGPEWSTKDLAWLFLVGFFGNVRYRPKHFAKLKNFA